MRLINACKEGVKSMLTPVPHKILQLMIMITKKIGRNLFVVVVVVFFFSTALNKLRYSFHPRRI